MWQNTCIMGQKRVWAHYVGITFFMSSTMLSLHDLDDGSMRRQQNILLLGMFLREQGQIFSHSFHDVAGVEDGTIIVQRGYSLALDVQEGLSSWGGLLICSIIMGYAFDILHVKYWSYVLMGAYLHRPTMLSLWS